MNMENAITTIDIETKVYQLLDTDMTLIEDDKDTLKRVMQYNPISKLYIIIRYDTIKEENVVLCITTKTAVAAKSFNTAFD